MIEMKDVYFSYPAGHVLNGLSLTINKAEYTGIMGGNGSGKTTLARLIAGLLLPQKGSVRVNGISTQCSNRLLEIRSTVGMVFQNPEAQIIGETVEEDLVFGLENLEVPVNEIDLRIDRYLSMLGIQNLRHGNTRLLSSGQKQLVNLADVMAMQPDCIIFDEPVSMIDYKHRRMILTFIKELSSKGTAVIHITHDPEELIWCNRIIIISHGRIIDQGTPCNVFDKLIGNDELDVPAAFAISNKLGLPPIMIPEELVGRIWLLRSRT
jgi:energy-coupling factor transporter ATPase